MNGRGGVCVLRGLGEGGFAPPRCYPVGNGTHDLAAADPNGDGRPDLAVTRRWGNAVVILLNRTPAARP